MSKPKLNVQTAKYDHAETFPQIRDQRMQKERPQIKRESSQGSSSAGNFKEDSPVVQHLNFSDAYGNNVQLNFSSNSLADHSKEEKFVLDVEVSHF